MTTLTCPAATPAAPTSTLSNLFEQIIIDLATNTAGHDPLARLHTVGELVRDSRWKSYRAGRARLCGLTGVYWTWLAPTAAWSFAGRSSTPIAWDHGADVIVDLPVCEGHLDDRAVRAQTDVLLRAGTEQFLTAFRGVRILSLSGVTRSRFVTADGRSNALIDTPFWFGGQSNE